MSSPFIKLAEDDYRKAVGTHLDELDDDNEALRSTIEMLTAHVERMCRVLGHATKEEKATCVFCRDLPAPRPGPLDSNGPNAKLWANLDRILDWVKTEEMATEEKRRQAP